MLRSILRSRWGRRQARSSAHYDPFHNLLCLVRGAKAVALASPAAAAALHALPPWGESSNHAAGDLEPPELPDAAGAAEPLRAIVAAACSREQGLACAARGKGLAEADLGFDRGGSGAGGLEACEGTMMTVTLQAWPWCGH